MNEKHIEDATANAVKQNNSDNSSESVVTTDSRWERPARTGTASRRSGVRRRTAATPDGAETAVGGSRGRPAPAPVPRDVPCEWTPALAAGSDLQHDNTGEEQNVVLSIRKGRLSTTEKESQPVVQETSSAAVENTRGTASADETGQRTEEGGKGDAQEAQTVSEMQEDGVDNYRQRHTRKGDNRRSDRYERQERPPARDGRKQPSRKPGGDTRVDSASQRSGQRRVSRQEARRMSRRERMQMRMQEDPYDPRTAGNAADSRADAPPPLKMSTLQALEVPALLAQAEELNLADNLASLHKHDVVFELLKHHARRGGDVIGEGVLEVMKDGTGFLRNSFNNYHTCPEDTFVLPAMIRRFGLRAGQTVMGLTRPPREPKGRNFVLVDVESVNGMTPAEARRITPFESLTPLFPNRRIHLDTTAEELDMRITNLFTPVGFGQRGLIVAPPRTGKTVLLQKMANAISANHPEVHLIILLIDERPEEVTDMQRNTKAHVLSSTFDEPPERHVQVADIVIEKSRRMVELGKDVVILLDSITRLARAYNTLQPNSGKILSGGVDANALQKPKRFFGAARNIEGGGSLTIVATALVDTGSRMDEVIFEEFKGTGNMELSLDRSLVDKRVFPAINIEKSGTRKEELLLHTEELARTWILRRALSGVPPVEAVEMILGRLKKTSTNAEFLMSMKE